MKIHQPVIIGANYPLLVEGILSILNWEIPVKYAIDSSGVCWMDNGHGGPLEKTTVKHLKQTVQSQLDKSQNQCSRVTKELKKHAK